MEGRNFDFLFNEAGKTGSLQIPWDQWGGQISWWYRLIRRINTIKLDGKEKQERSSWKHLMKRNETSWLDIDDFIKYCSKFGKVWRYMRANFLWWSQSIIMNFQSIKFTLQVYHAVNSWIWLSPEGFAVGPCLPVSTHGFPSTQCHPKKEAELGASATLHIGGAKSFLAMMTF